MIYIMKTKYGKMLELLFIVLLLMGNTPIWGQETTNADDSFITVSGVVKNEQNKKKLAFVNISVPGTTLGTVTNEDGEFTLKIKNSLHAKEISVSHLGYANNIVSLTENDMANVIILMKPYKYLLGEVVVHANNPLYIVEKAISKIAVNYNSQNSLLTGFYRETAQKGHRFINISEAVLDIYKTSYSKGFHKVKTSFSFPKRQKTRSCLF